MAPRSPYDSATARSTLALPGAMMPRSLWPRRERLLSGSARPATRSSTCLLPCSVLRLCRYRCSRSTACRWGCRSPVLSVRTPRCSRRRPRSAICWAQRRRLAPIFFGGIDALRVAHPVTVAFAGRGRRSHRPADRAGALRRTAWVRRCLADRALFHRRERLQRRAAVRVGCRDAHREDPDRLRGRAAALPPPGAARRPAGAARQSEQGPDRCRSGQGHDLQRVRICRPWAAQRRQPRAHGGGDRHHRTPVGRWARHLQWQVFPGAGAAIAARPVQRPHLPLWRGVISPSSFSECGRLGVPILTARLPVTRIKERWATYGVGLDAGGHDAATKARLLAQSALWRNVYVAESNAQAEDELSALLLQTRAHMMHVRAAYNPADFTIDPAMLNPWADPVVGGDEAVKFVLATGSLYGSPARVRDQVAELRDAGMQHLLCQTGFGAMSHDQNLASMCRFGEEVMPAFQI